MTDLDIIYPRLRRYVLPNDIFPVSNLTFRGRNRCRLFICASHTLYAVYTNQRGAARPRAHL